MSAESQAWDVIIIGAGIYGIQFARTYLELHPSRRIVILEASGSVGGVWSKGTPKGLKTTKSIRDTPC